MGAKILAIISYIKSGSWKTGTAGVVAIVLILLSYFGLMEQDLAEKAVLVILGIGTYNARDDNKSSEDIGIKK